jgi:CopG family nickel-responsive transcriptional regulator
VHARLLSITRIEFGITGAVLKSYSLVIIVLKRGFRLVNKGVSRFSVSAPSDLLQEFNSAISDVGYSRSEAVQTAMRNLLSEWRWVREAKGIMTGAIVVIYDHEARGVEEGLTNTQHHNQDIISSTMHIHLDDRHCLEMVAVKGEVKEVQKLAKELTRQRGVKQTKLALVALPR